jgi:hypothetical protein
MERMYINPRSLDLSSTWKRVVSLIPQPHNLRYPLDRRLGDPQSRSGRRRDERIFSLAGTRTLTLPAVQSVASTMPTALSRLHENAERHIFILGGSGNNAILGKNFLDKIFVQKFDKKA